MRHCTLNELKTKLSNKLPQIHLHLQYCDSDYHKRWYAMATLFCDGTYSKMALRRDKCINKYCKQVACLYLFFS